MPARPGAPGRSAASTIPSAGPWPPRFCWSPAVTVWWVVEPVRRAHWPRHRAVPERHALRGHRRGHPAAAQGAGSARRRGNPHRQGFRRGAANWPTARRWKCASAPAFPLPATRAISPSAWAAAASSCRPRNRRKGHLYVDTADCRVAVTGTLFGVTAGVKGSRISVVQGEVHVTQDNQEKILHAGDQTVTGASVEPESVGDEIAWSRNRDRSAAAVGRLRTPAADPPAGAALFQQPAGPLARRHGVLCCSIPNLAQYLAEAQSVLRQKMAGKPAIARAGGPARPPHRRRLEKLRAGSEYLGDEIDVVACRRRRPARAGLAGGAEARRDSPNFSKAGHRRWRWKPQRAAWCSARTRRRGSGLAPALDRFGGFAAHAVLCAHRRIVPRGRRPADVRRPLVGRRSRRRSPGRVISSPSRSRSDGQMVASATLGFDGPRTGMAAWLAEPAPMGSLDYISPDASPCWRLRGERPGAHRGRSAGDSRVARGRAKGAGRRAPANADSTCARIWPPAWAANSPWPWMAR